MADFIAFALALWIVTHTVATEIPVTARARKPLSCQLCLAGWISLITGVVGSVVADRPGALIAALAAWGASVLLEALYQRLKVYVL